MKPKLITYLLFLVFSWSYFSLAYPTDTSLFVQQMKSENKSEKLPAYLNAGFYQKYIVGNHYMADSLSKKAVLEAHLMENSSLIIQSAMAYSQLCLPQHGESANKYLQEAIEIVQKNGNTQLLFELFTKQTALALRQGKTNQASESLQKTMEYLGDMKSNKIKYYLFLGDLQNASKDKINSFSNYNNAVYLAKEIENDSLTIQAYIRLYEFFLFKEKDSKAKEYLKLALETYSHSTHKDVYDSLLLKANQVEIYTRENNDELALNLAEGLMQFASVKGYLAIKDRIFGSLRKYYLSANKYREICDLYCTKYPAELERLQQNDPAVYYRVKALIYENLQQIDSAEYVMQQAESLLLKESNAANLANFYKRRGQFQLRHQRLNEAIASFRLSNEYALKSHYFPFIIESAAALDSLYVATGNINEAYHYAKLNYIYTDSNNAVLQNDQMSEIEIENNIRLKKLQDEKEEIMLNRKSNFQVMIIVLAILLSLIILVLLSSYRIPASIVKGFGYMTFVLVFEFIILLLDTKIHHWAHGQPIKIMAVKIVLIAILLPIHHATEHKVVHYLLKNKLISQGSTSIKTAFGNFKEWLSKTFTKSNETHEVEEASAHEQETKGDA